MLKKPYRKIHQIDDTNYYILETKEGAVVAIESVVRYKWFFKVRDFSTGFKLFELSSPMLLLLSRFVSLPKVGESPAKEGMAAEEYFDILDVAALRKHLKELVDAAENKNHRYNYRKTTHNPAVEQLIKEGFELLNVEDLGTYMRKNWIARSDKNGVLRIVEVVLGGKPSEEKVIDVKFYTFNKQVGEIIVNEMVNILKNKKENE